MKAIIDGRPYQSAGGTTILRAAASLGIDVPSLCDRPGLEPAAACRLCLVEVTGRRDPVPACSTPVEDGMRVSTDTPALRGLRRSVLEMILAEHPSACLVCPERADCREPKAGIRKTAEPTGCVLCPKDGRCRLQDVAARVGLEATAYPEAPRIAEPRRDDPLIDRDQALCVLCGLCVRVCRDVRGASVLTFLGRGGRTTVGTALDGSLRDSGCRFCGACVDVCPTGALLERASRYARPDRREPLLCGLCADGCRLDAAYDGGTLASTVPSDGPANRGQACVKGRFLTVGLLTDPSRLTAPLVRRDGSLQPAGWPEALAAAAAGLAAAGPDLEVVGSARDSCEDLRALAALTETVFPGGRFRLAGPPVPASALAAASNEAIAGMKSLLILDEDLPSAAPILGLHVFRAVKAGARLVVYGEGECGLGRCAKVRVRRGAEPASEFLLDVCAVVADSSAAGSGPGRAELIKSLKGRRPDEKAARAAAILEKRRPSAVLFGPGLLAGPAGPRNEAALADLALLAGAAFVPVLRDANALGALAVFGPRAWDRPAGGAESSRGVLSAAGPFPPSAAGSFRVRLAAFADEAGVAEADVVLPRTLFAEQEGMWVSREGRIQRSRAAAAAPGQARPILRIAADLAAAAGRPDSRLGSFETVRADLAKAVPALAEIVDGGGESALLRLPAGRPGARFVPLPAGSAAPAEDAAAASDELLGLERGWARRALDAVRRR